MEISVCFYEYMHFSDGKGYSVTVWGYSRATLWPGRITLLLDLQSQEVNRVLELDRDDLALGPALETSTLIASDPT